MHFEISVHRKAPGLYRAIFQLGMRGYAEERSSAFEAVVGAVYGWLMSFSGER